MDRLSRNDRQRITQYQQRNAILKRLGYATYADYLASPVWAAIRLRVLNRDCWKCRGCNREASQVHHHAYTVQNLIGKELRSLSAICRRCHEQIEFDRRNGKLSLSQANKKLSKKHRRSRNGRHKSQPKAIRNHDKPRDPLHRRYLDKVAEINRTLKGRKRNTALADALRERTAEIGRYPKGVIPSTPTYPTRDAAMFSGEQSESQRLNVVNVPSMAATS